MSDDTDPHNERIWAPPITGTDGISATDVRAVAASIPRRESTSGLVRAMRDSWTEATRHLRIVPRNVELLIFATLQPVMFVLLFVYVFGGAIEVPGFDHYDQFLTPEFSPSRWSLARHSRRSASLKICRRAISVAVAVAVAVAADGPLGCVDRPHIL